MPIFSPDRLSPEQGKILLTLARQTIAARLDQPVSSEKQQSLEKALQDHIFNTARGTFVTLHKQGELRGCIGTIAPDESIAEGIRRNAVNAAFGDYRFANLTAAELNQIDIEVSILTDPAPLDYSDGDDLLSKLHPNIDGVIIRAGSASATFLPQVWEQLPRPEDFLSHLCSKAGLPSDTWKNNKLEVQIYQVQHFSE